VSSPTPTTEDLVNLVAGRKASVSLADVRKAFRRYLHFPDPVPLYVLLAVVLANRMEQGEPVWLVLVAGSSRGKTELLAATGALPYVRVVGELTPASLLSGTPAKERAKKARGGLLREIPTEGAILCVKDLGAILAMPNERRASTLQALRDVYDGLYTRDVGAGGGEHLEWKGRVGLVAGATGELDRHHAVIAVLGERWITLRLHAGKSREMATAALRRHDTQAMRAELADKVGGYLGSVEPPELVDLDADDEELVASLATFAVLARSPVIRDRHTREIELVPQSEGPGRLARQLHKLALCLRAIGLSTGEVHSTLRRIALDSISSPRRETTELVLAAGGMPLTTTEVCMRLGLPRSTSERALFDAAALGLLVRTKAASHETSANQWRATEEALELWRAASPAITPPPFFEEPKNPEEDFAGEGEPAPDEDEIERLAERARAAQRDNNNAASGAARRTEEEG
jgi:hypothetical protein